MPERRVALVLCCTLLTLQAGVSMAQPMGVESVQSPAWLERGGRSVPLAPGMALQAQDKVVTGPNARVRFRMRDGEVGRLGADSQLVVPRDGDREGTLARTLQADLPAEAPDSEKASSWKVVAAIHPKRDAALAMARQLRAAGFPAEIQALEGYHLVQVLRLESEAQARNVMANLRGQPGVTLPKVVPLP